MMRKTIAITALSIAVLGVGGTVLAESASAATPAAQTAHSTHHHRSGHGDFDRAVHAQWTSFDAKTKTFVDHDEIRGTVTAVSPAAVTVKAADGTTQTYTVGTGTKIHDKANGKGKTGAITEVKAGDRAVVVGTGKTTLAATRIDDSGVHTTKTTPTA